MARQKILSKILPVSEVIVEDFYENNLAYEWEVKAKRLRARRLRKLKHQWV